MTEKHAGRSRQCQRLQNNIKVVTHCLAWSLRLRQCKTDKSFSQLQKILSIVQRYDRVQCSVGDWKGIPVPNGLAAFQLGGNINQGISTPICILRHYGGFTIFFSLSFLVGLLHYLKSDSYWYNYYQENTNLGKRFMQFIIHGNTYFTFGLCLNLSGSSSKVKVRLLWVVPHFFVCLSWITMSSR